MFQPIQRVFVFAEARLGVILASEAGIVQASPCPVLVVAERHGPGDICDADDISMTFL